MADTNPLDPSGLKTESDGISYRGLGVSAVVLTAVTLICYLIVWGVFGLIESQVDRADTGRSPLAGSPSQPTISNGRLVTGNLAPPPGLLITEPVNLQHFREAELTTLTTYGWVDQNAGTVRLPIERAKQLLLERGLPARAAR